MTDKPLSAAALAEIQRRAETDFCSVDHAHTPIEAAFDDRRILLAQLTARLAGARVGVLLAADVCDGDLSQYDPEDRGFAGDLGAAIRAIPDAELLKALEK